MAFYVPQKDSFERYVQSFSFCWNLKISPIFYFHRPSRALNTIKLHLMNTMSINLPDLPSWLWLLLIGLGVVVVLSNPVGWMIAGVAFIIGLVYFGLDIANKL